MKSVVVLPGRPAQWITDHARDVAQRLSDHGAVVVAFMGSPHSDIPLAGQSPPASVLGHSAAGHPLWTGRIGTGVALVPRRRVAVLVLWQAAGVLATMMAATAARLRGDYLVLDVVEPTMPPASSLREGSRSLARRLAHDVVEVEPEPDGSPDERTLLALCGRDVELARLVLTSLDSMSVDAAGSWRCEVRVDPAVLDQIEPHRARHDDLVSITVTDGEVLGPADADVVVAAAASDESTVVRESVATGGAGVLIGSATSQVVRCHDGVWLARREVSAVLVAIEASVGRTRRTSVARLRDVARRVERLVWEHEIQQRERWAGRPRRHSGPVTS